MLFKKQRIENRAYPRVDFFQPSFFMVENDAVPSATDCWFNNISLGGLSIESDRERLDEAEISVLYRIGRQMRKDRLRVKFSKKLMTKWRYGCQFMLPDEQRSSLIEEYVTKKIDEGSAG